MTISVDMRDVDRGMNALEKRQLPQAGVWALNDTAYDILKDLQNRMDVVFDRPTRFTKNAFMVWRANKKTMEAAVQERPSVGNRHYLKVQEGGGARGSTGMEGMLRGLLGSSAGFAALVPTSAAKLDASGNWSRAQRTKALDAAMSGSSAMGRAAGARRGASYFVPKGKGALSPGIWQRSGKGAVTKIVSFAKEMPVYEEKLGFQDGAEVVFEERMPVNFAAAFERAMATAK